MSEVKVEFEKVEDMVKDILEKYPEARSEDHFLYVVLVTRYKNVPFNEYTFIGYKLLGLPAFETVSRARRRVQRENEYLASNETKELRMQREQQYIEYYGAN